MVYVPFPHPLYTSDSPQPHPSMHLHSRLLSEWDKMPIKTGDCPWPYIPLVRVGYCQYIWKWNFPVFSFPGKVNLRAKLNWQWQRLSIFSNRGQPFCLSGLARTKMYTFLFASDNTPIILENCKLHPLLPSMNCRQHPIQFVESVNGFLLVKSVNSISVPCM